MAQSFMLLRSIGATNPFHNLSIDTWATWHWFRTGLTIGALIFASWSLLLPTERDDSIAERLC
jgi:hypothetical protein